MMNASKKLLFLFFSCTIFLSCKNDDDTAPVIPPRDKAEVAIEDHAKILEFLKTHKFEMAPNPLNPDYQLIVFSQVSSGSSEALINSEFLEQKTIIDDDVEYTLYYLKIREGAPSQPKPTFADYVVTTYRGQLLDLTKFDESVNPFRFNLPGEDGSRGVITGLMEALFEFRGASDYTVNPDNTIEFSDDFGIGAVFIPSGLAYFARNDIGSIPQYSSLIFTFQLYKTIQGDHDGDGVPSVYEDLNGDRFLITDDTDKDGAPNFLDTDDDGDGIPTREEVIIDDKNDDGYISEDEITFPDSDGDGTPDYLDPDS